MQVAGGAVRRRILRAIGIAAGEVAAAVAIRHPRRLHLGQGGTARRILLRGEQALHRDLEPRGDGHALRFHAARGQRQVLRLAHAAAHVAFDLLAEVVRARRLLRPLLLLRGRDARQQQRRRKDGRAHQAEATSFCVCSPRPAMPSFITCPAFRNTGAGFLPSPTPGGVPVKITSPGFSVMHWLT